MSSLSTGHWVVAVPILALLLCLYFLPCIVAHVRGKAHGGVGIVLLNLCLGWTVFGWFAALIWASSGTTNKELQAQEQRHRELLAALRPVDAFLDAVDRHSRRERP